jgi:DNA-binding NtrC family response regulator
MDKRPLQRRAKVLVVDDDKQIGQLIKAALKEFKTETLQSRAELLQRLKREPVDALLLDWRLEDGDGIVLIDAIRDAWPGTSIILMTGYGTNEVIIRAIKRGAFHFLAKPFDAAALRQTVRRAIDNTRISQAGRAARKN